MKQQFVDFVINNVDLRIVFFYISGGYFSGLYIQFPVFSKSNAAYDKTLKALLMGSIFTMIYLSILFSNGLFPRNVWQKMFLSYVISTSFYDLLLRPFNDVIMSALTALHNKINKLFGGTTNKKEPPKENKD